MLHRNLYIENEMLWAEIKILSHAEGMTISAWIEKQLSMVISDKKSKALTPEKMAFFIRKKFVKNEFITPNKIVDLACGGVFIPERRLKTYLRDLELNNVIRPTRKRFEASGAIEEGWVVV